MIRAQSLGYTFASGRVGLTAVDLDVSGGETVALLGPNGSGKTTLLRLIAGDLKPTNGSIALDARSIGWGSAEAMHFEELSGRENARFFARAHHADDATVDTWLSAFNLDGAVLAGEYSFGMQRKLLLLEAFAHEPDLLLIDEPAIGLDPPGIATLVAAVRACAQRGGTVIMGSNDLGLAMVADRVVFLHNGRKIADAPPSELLAPIKGVKRIDISLEEPAADPVPEITNALARAGARIRDIRLQEPDLGDVFRMLTGENLDPPG